MSEVMFSVLVLEKIPQVHTVLLYLRYVWMSVYDAQSLQGMTFAVAAVPAHRLLHINVNPNITLKLIEFWWILKPSALFIAAFSTLSWTFFICSMCPGKPHHRIGYIRAPLKSVYYPPD